jgi:uncharacterized protein YukE
MQAYFMYIEPEVDMSGVILVNRESFEDTHGFVNVHIAELGRLKQELINTGLDISAAWESNNSSSFSAVDWSNQQLLEALIQELERINKKILLAKEAFEDRDAHESARFQGVS